MKIKEDILRWQSQIKILNEQSKNMLSSSETLQAEVKELKQTISKLVDISNEMTEALLTLISQQIGD